MNNKSIFLIDGVGAIISALFLGVILPTFHEKIGLPQSSLYFLSIFPIIFCLYSFACFSKLKKLQQYHFYIIALFNLCYCMITVFKIGESLGSITDLGYIYFLIELILILLLASYEIKRGIVLGKINDII